jgi:predicted phage tail protein
MWQNWISVILGIAIISVAFFTATGTTVSWVFRVLGAIVILVGISGAETSTNSN